MLGSQRDVILGDGKIKDNSTWKINKPSFSSKVKTPSSKWYRMLDRGTNTHQDHPLEKATISPTITNKSNTRVRASARSLIKDGL